MPCVTGCPPAKTARHGANTGHGRRRQNEGPTRERRSELGHEPRAPGLPGGLLAPANRRLAPSVVRNDQETDSQVAAQRTTHEGESMSDPAENIVVRVDLDSKTSIEA